MIGGVPSEINEHCAVYRAYFMVLFDIGGIQQIFGGIYFNKCIIINVSVMAFFSQYKTGRNMIEEAFITIYYFLLDQRDELIGEHQNFRINCKIPLILQIRPN